VGTVLPLTTFIIDKGNLEIFGFAVVLASKEQLEVHFDGTVVDFL